MTKLPVALAAALAVSTARAQTPAAPLADVDVHLHTYCSDGLRTPEEVVRDAAAAGLAQIAITDHDGVACVERARKEAARLGLTAIAGIEIGADDDSLHVLGLGIDPAHAGIRALAADVAAEHGARLRKMLATLAGRGMPLDFKLDLVVPRLNRELAIDGKAPLTAAEAAAESEEALAARLRGPLLLPDLAQALVARGYAASVQDAFGRFIGDEAPNSAKLPIQAISFRKAIELVHAAGGIAILAHPYTVYKYKPFPRTIGGRSYPDFETLARELLDAGLDGFEYYRPGSEKFPKDAAVLDAIRTDWLAAHPGRRVLYSAGSDYHGYAGAGGVGPKAPGGASYPLSESRAFKAALGLPR